KKKNVIVTLILILIILINIGLISSQMTIFSCMFILFLFMLHFLKIALKKIKFDYFKPLVLLIVGLSVLGGVLLFNKIREDHIVESRANIVYRVKHFIENGDITRRKNWYSAYSVIKHN